MKTQTRRFSAVLSCIALVITAFMTVPSVSRGQGWIGVEMTYGSYIKTPQLIGDVVTARSNNYSSFGQFNAIANGSTVNITNIFRSGSVGQSVYFTLAMTNSTPFTLSQVNMTSTDPYTSLSGSLGDFGVSYTGMGIGIGVDGTVYTSGNANTPVYAIYIIGLGRTIDITGQSVSDAQASWAAGCPFTTQTTFSLGSLTSSAQVTFVDPVPEPSTFALAGLGGLTILLARLRKNRSK
ncbi:MAG TPA: PEP-CTERM sorting domain-containing protein [Candidatus Paceibacterota bacterium]|jgi:hypothetical protein|nr:PEP-CTERM sorting domain-containing protein [Candidatus Paceibacterota bacterium]